MNGHIENGVVVFDQPVSLPNGTPVRVEISTSPANPKPARQGGWFLEHYRDVIGKSLDLPTDGAENIDHYLYDLPKQ
ncbi:MAG: hypothetical protein ACJ8C4_07680 [Gemmataceae bacterium]